MAKLTKFKAQQVEFPTHYEVEETNRGNNKIKSIVPAFGNIRENGTPETEEIYDGLQLGNVHTLQANKTTNLNIDYYVCNLDGLNEFGVNNDLKLRINVDSRNTNSTTKLRLNNNDYTILKEYNGNLKQIEAGDFKPNKTYELTYNGSQFVVINIDSRLNEIMGLEFGGNIQDAGDKVKGKCYFDNVTKFYYECIEDNSLTYNDSGKFRAISNKPISDKVEKLSEIEIASLGIAATQAIVAKQGKICTLSVDSAASFVGKGYGEILAYIPVKFRPAYLVAVSTSVEGAIHIFPSGEIISRIPNRITGAIHFNASYVTT